MRGKPATLAGMAALAVGLGLVVPTSFVPAGPAAAVPPPCGTMALTATSYQHVVWIWMENHSASSVIGPGQPSAQAPYINSLATSCGLATNYHNISHPSLPNYVAATSGLALTSLAPFVSDCTPSRRCSTTAPSIFGQGESWKAYEESMPVDCDRKNVGDYAVRHNPPPYFKGLSYCKPHRRQRHGPKVSFDVPYTQLANDLASGSLPAFSFVTPNLVDDMHNGTVTDGDTWLADNLPAILSSAAYQAGQVVVFVTWDEGEGGPSNDCAANTTDVGCQVATIVVSPSTPAGVQSSTLFNHYSLLRTTEELLGLPLLGQAAGANSMVGAFSL